LILVLKMKLVAREHPPKKVEDQILDNKKNEIIPSSSHASSTNDHHHTLPDTPMVEGTVIPSRAKTLTQLICTTTVENLLTNGGNVVSLNENNTIEDALKAFKDTEAQAMPLYDGEGKFMRVIEIRDIFYYFCCNEIEDLEFFFKRSLENLFGSGLSLPSKDSPLVPIGTLLSDVIKTLSTGIHHVGVIDELSQSLFIIISQLYVVQFIAKNISLMSPELRRLPVSQFMRQIVTVMNIPSDTKTREAFEYLFTDNVSAAAVVHHITGDIIDTISTTDIVGVVYDRFSHLQKPVVDFLFATRRTKALKPPITCKMEDTFEYVIMKLASTGVHRLWVVDSAIQTRYLGLVSLTDVLFTISQNLE